MHVQSFLFLFLVVCLRDRINICRLWTVRDGHAGQVSVGFGQLVVLPATCRGMPRQGPCVGVRVRVAVKRVYVAGCVTKKSNKCTHPAFVRGGVDKS